MNIESRLKKIESSLKIDFKPKLYGSPIVWSDELETEWLEKARVANKNLARPILGGMSKNYEM